jgi:DNA-binding XRE family transcriptional regulator
MGLYCNRCPVSVSQKAVADDARLSRKCSRVRGVDQQVIELVRLRARCRSGAARSVRLAAGLSLREVANVGGVSPTTILRWEGADARPRGAVAFRYGELLDELVGATR